VFASCFYVLFKFCFVRGGAQGPPLVTSFKMSFLFFLKQFALHFRVLFKFWFVREGTQGSPLVNPINNVFFFFMMLITS